MKFCAVVGCSNRSNREEHMRFFKFPSVRSRQKRVEAARIQRRASWIEVLQRVGFTDSKASNSFVCSAHFITGQPSEDPGHPDYIPSQNMGYETKDGELQLTVYPGLTKRNKESKLKPITVFKDKKTKFNSKSIFVMDVEDIHEVTHIDHAYACQRNYVEEDPLKLPEPHEDVFVKTEIKTEDMDMDIKIEEPDTYEVENNEHLNFEPGETSFYDLDEVCDTANIEFVEHTTFQTGNEPTVLYYSIEDRNETMVPTTSTNLPTDKLVQENKKLKKAIARLKKEKVDCYSSIESSSRKFYDDLDKMHHIQCDLQKEIQALRDENEKYQNQLICYEKLKKHHLDLETHILELRRQAHQFMKYEKITIANIKTMKTDMDAKTNETKAVRNRLAATVKRLTYLKAKLAKLVNINKMQAVKASQCAELQAKLKNAVRMNNVYDVHIKSFKTQFDQRIKEKLQDIDSAKKEIDILKKSNQEKEAVCKLFKEKYKFSVQHERQKMQAYKKGVDNMVKVRLDKVKILLSQKESESEDRLTRISELEKELDYLKNKGCDYCGL